MRGGGWGNPLLALVAGLGRLDRESGECERPDELPRSVALQLDEEAPGWRWVDGARLLAAYLRGRPQRVGELGIGLLYLLADCHREWHGEVVETLHVMSPAVGGQVRGYRREPGGVWAVWLPAYEGHWPEVDQAVANLTGEAVADLHGALVRPERQLALAQQDEDR